MQTNKEFLLSVWDQNGRVLVHTLLDGRTVSLSSQVDSDVFVPELESDSVIINTSGKSIQLFYQYAQGDSKTFEVTMGQPVSIGRFSWLMNECSDGALRPMKAAKRNEQSGKSALVSELASWLAKPMNTPSELRQGLAECIRILVLNSSAINGLLILAENGQFSLVAAHGLSMAEANEVWSKMPTSISQDIVDQEAKIILPDGLREKVGSHSTVFVKGVRSLAGFPLFAEQKLIAILYLGFNNILCDLSPSVQSEIESACNILAMVIQRATLRAEIDAVKIESERLSYADNLPRGRLMLGSSPQIVDIYRLLLRIAPVNVPVLILGETGTGKELAAREIHRLSDRHNKPFVAVNASALPESLFEAEFFGYKKGAFTGSTSDRVGLVEKADGGVLFIDEIAELPVSMQVKLLRVLQERAIVRLGESEPRRVDFRLVCATHRDIKAMVDQGSFRDDLYYRVAGAVLNLPRLAERREDIPELASFFRRRFAAQHNFPDKEWSSDAIRAMLNYAWPGNVRELENVVSRAFVMCDGPAIGVRELGHPFNEMHEPNIAEAAEPIHYVQRLSEAKKRWLRDYINVALEKQQGNKTKTARVLGIGERTLFRYIEQLGIKG